MKLLLTCEHGGNEIPKKYLGLFENATEALNSHRGYDPGALDLFFYLRSLADFSSYSTCSRLLIELNRSLHHPKLFSEYTKQLSKVEKEELILKYYRPYRTPVENQIEEWIQEGEKVLHISVHSFTPVFEGVSRNADIGFLYDPSHPGEKQVVKKWEVILKEFAPEWKVRFNYPYLGTADGFTTYLRSKFPEDYMGIELEVNQKFSTNSGMDADVKNCIKKLLEIN